MEKFKALSYVEKSFEQFCVENDLSLVILNDVVITATGQEEFSSDFVVKLLNLVNIWNSMSLFADKHITFRFGLSGLCSGESVIKPYLRIWFECDGLISYSNYFFE